MKTLKKKNEGNPSAPNTRDANTQTLINQMALELTEEKKNLESLSMKLKEAESQNCLLKERISRHEEESERRRKAFEEEKEEFLAQMSKLRLEKERINSELEKCREEVNSVVFWNLIGAGALLTRQLITH